MDGRVLSHSQHLQEVPIKTLLKKIRLAALSILLYNLILILSIWLGKVSSKEEFMIAVAGNAVMMGLSFVHLHNQVSDEFHGKVEEPSA
ncbi:hypothetical protein PCN97_08205 [Streptococcus suis]|uniref:hypothetical protein n=1 Tax=Streptococcus suis TaxID=1307 RepID=UPI000941D227|nr:hypothetical protein [Streptococcus suis]MDN2960173.1 hypothetical protein [Streptococcus suis]MDN2967912.1 hypothetical protein [Streptococcus suis]MDN2971672.1 hypothetical protein [Streptococcus suis]MDN2973738.1 hypothetical protein [Streptococcus suis]MDN2981560.1 hypothetical protein [Streptococcus suis]